MLLTIILCGGLNAAQCTPITAVQAIQIPAVFASPAACMAGAEFILAEMPRGNYRVICAHAFVYLPEGEDT